MKTKRLIFLFSLFCILCELSQSQEQPQKFFRSRRIPRFWPSKTANSKQEYAFISMPKNGESLIKQIKWRRTQQNKIEPRPATTSAYLLSPRPGDLPICTNNPVQTTEKSEWMEYFLARSNVRGNQQQKAPFAKEWNDIKCDLCKRVTNYFFDYFVASNISFVPNYVLQPNVVPENVCEAIMKNMRTETSESTIRTLRVNFVNSAHPNAAKFMEIWFKLCKNTVKEYTTDSTVLTKLQFYRIQYEKGEYSGIYPETKPNHMFCALLDCCFTRGILSPYGNSEFNFFDEFSIEPNELIFLAQKEPLKGLGCALSQQRLIINLEVAVDTSVGPVNVFGTKLTLDHSLKGQDPSVWKGMIRTMRKRLDPAFHFLGPVASRLRVRQMIKKLSAILEEIFGDKLSLPFSAYQSILNIFDIPRKPATSWNSLPTSIQNKDKDQMKPTREFKPKPTSISIIPDPVKTENDVTMASQFSLYPSTVHPRFTIPEDKVKSLRWHGVSKYLSNPPWKSQLLENPSPYLDNSDSEIIFPKYSLFTNSQTEETSEERLVSTSSEENKEERSDKEDSVEAEGDVNSGFFWFKNAPISIYDIISIFLISPAMRETIENSQKSLDYILSEFMATNPKVEPPSIRLLDTSAAGCVANDKGTLAPAVPSILDIRIVNVTGFVDISSVYQSRIPISSALIKQLNINMQPNVPEESVFCGGLPTFIPLELRVNIIRDRSLHIHKDDLNSKVFGIEWWVGDKKLVGKYLPCVILVAYMTKSKLPLCGSSTSVQGLSCIEVPQIFGELKCAELFSTLDFKCESVSHKNPSWNPLTGERVDASFIQSVGGVHQLNEGYSMKAAKKFCESKGMYLAQNFNSDSALIEADGFDTYDFFNQKCNRTNDNRKCVSFSKIDCQVCFDEKSIRSIAEKQTVLVRPCRVPGDPECVGKPYLTGVVTKIDKSNWMFQVLDSNREVVWVSKNDIIALPKDHPCCSKDEKKDKN